MKALLTGITGNLGFETARALSLRDIEIVPHIRPSTETVLESFGVPFATPVVGDLLEGLGYEGDIDCVVHAAGVVHFKDAGTQNARMMQNVVAFAKARAIPIHYVSTAFVYRPDGNEAPFTNSYERDKWNAEEELSASGVRYSILRPSVLMGNTRTGTLRTYSGYYLIVKALLAAARAAHNAGRPLRFPNMTGNSDVVPVDQVAEAIACVVQEERFETLFLTNPEPPKASWMFAETLRFFGLSDTVQVLDIAFEAFGRLPLTEEEEILFMYAKHFSPYWSMEYRFPDSLCEKNYVNRDYLEQTLTAFAKTISNTHA